MLETKVNRKSVVGEQMAADFAAGSLKFDGKAGAFIKESTNQQWLLTNQDRLVRVDGNAHDTMSLYNPSTSQFVPTNALKDGESLDRTRALKPNDILAKATWKQWAGEGAWTVANAAVVGASLGVIGGMAAVAGQSVARRGLSHGDNASVPFRGGVSPGPHLRAAPGGIAVAKAALHAPGPYNPGDLRQPPPININPPPPAGLTPGQAAQEQAAQGAFAAAGAIVGGAVAGPLAPVGAIVGGIIGAGLGALWNEAVR